MKSLFGRTIDIRNTYYRPAFPRILKMAAVIFMSGAVLSARDMPDHRGDTREFDFSPHEEASIQEVWKADMLVEAIVQIESNGNPFSVGRAGERGLMQIKKETWQEVTSWMFGSELPFDQAFMPNLNKRVGRAYLADLQIFLHKHRESWVDNERSLLLACYNAGPNRVYEAGFNLKKLPAANRDYVQRASALHDYYITSKQGTGEEFVLLSRTASVEHGREKN